MSNIFRYLTDQLSGKELFIRFTARAFRILLSMYVFSYFPFGFDGRIWDLIVSVPDHCLSFYFVSKRYDMIWTASSEFGTYRICEQRRFRRACASAQSRQNLRCSLIQAMSQEEPSDKARFLASLNGWACAVKICHDGMLEDTNSLDRGSYYDCGISMNIVLRCITHSNWIPI